MRKITLFVFLRFVAFVHTLASPANHVEHVCKEASGGDDGDVSSFLQSAPAATVIKKVSTPGILRADGSDGSFEDPKGWVAVKSAKTEQSPREHKHRGEHGALPHGEAARGAAHGHHEKEAHAHGHHGEEGEEGHRGEEGLESESFALACFLMGGVAALMMIFYLVNSPHSEIKSATWNVLSMTTSIFVAVLIYGTVRKALLHFLEPSFPARVAMVAMVLILFIICYVGTHFLLLLLKQRKRHLQSVATLMAHITGFAAMYGFADSAELPFIKESGIHGKVLLIITAAACIAILSMIMDKVMITIAMQDSTLDEFEERWIDICQETDDDVFCLAVSFLLLLFFRFLIGGQSFLAYEPGHVGKVNQQQTNQLVGVAIAFTVLVIIGGATLMIGGQVENPYLKRACTVWHDLNSNTMVWLILFWAEWQLYAAGWASTVIGGCLLVAVCLTVCSFAVVVILGEVMSKLGRHAHKAALRTVRSFQLALGILVGFSWERAFDVGLEELEHKCEMVGAGHGTGFWVASGVSLALIIIVAPAWRNYILPIAMSLDEKEESECMS